mmetsp:Transcript_64207/g.76009  ORF Transcript_64207/g.76009 Transcript_64207/m.76009 type:complete len:84 (-) Transcript_64207:444-695(-)
MIEANKALKKGKARGAVLGTTAASRANPQKPPLRPVDKSRQSHNFRSKSIVTPQSPHRHRQQHFIFDDSNKENSGNRRIPDIA